MVNSQTIYAKANALMKKYNTNNTTTLAQSSNIYIEYTDRLSTLLGVYSIIQRCKVIFINENLDVETERLVIAHELGHAILHHELAQNKQFTTQINLFNSRDISCTEYEANVFASHILIDTDEFLEYAKEGYTVEQIAQTLSLHTNLVVIKLQELIRLGHDLQMTMDVNRNFLKGIRA